MKLEKGMLVSNGLWWFVVIEVYCRKDTNKTYIGCVCDNANNIYSFEPQEIEYYLPLKAIARWGYGKPNNIPENLRDREIPFDVISEVLAGGEDDRFEHLDGD